MDLVALIFAIIFVFAMFSTNSFIIKTSSLFLCVAAIILGYNLLKQDPIVTESCYVSNELKPQSGIIFYIDKPIKICTIKSSYTWMLFSDSNKYTLITAGE